jgi:8-oxo-dGTP pyrophosphatase MutT (NUDIX family)
MAIDDSWYQRQAGSPEQVAAGGVVVRSEGGRPFVALVRDGDEGAYVLPKGRLERGETPEEAARREIGEEAGLHDLELLAPLGTRARYDYRKTHWKPTHYFLYRTRQLDGQPTDRHRAYVLSWFPADALPPMFWPEQAALIAEILDELRRLAEAETDGGAAGGG